MPEEGVARHIGGLIFDIVVSETQTDKIGITDHPVQSGAVISDHAYIMPRELSVIVGKGAKDGEEVPKETYDQIKELQKKREPIEIVTGKDTYQNMLIEDITITTDQTTENVLVATLTCREIITVETQNIQVAKSPSKKKQTHGDRTGSTKQGGSKQAIKEDPPEQKRKSIAKGLFG